MTTPDTDGYAIRAMSPREVVTAIEWAAAEGWNPGVHDAECFRAVDPNGFLMGFLNGEPIASISVVKYGTAFGFLGLYIVKPSHRGGGYGLRLWKAGLDYLGDRSVGLDGVVAQQANYRSSGFELAYRNVRYEGSGGNASPIDPRVVPLSTIPFAALDRYDEDVFRVDRARFLDLWIRQPQCAALGFVQGGALAGYGVRRRALVGHKIGPLFANDAEAAEALFGALAADVPADEPVYLDVPEPNAAAVDLARRHDMRIVFETARMYAGGAPDVPVDRVFGVTTFELG